MHTPFQEALFEVHIVGYPGTDLSEVPAPFFTNHIDQSTQGFSAIATAECADVAGAYRAFDEATRWCAAESAKSTTFGVHAKLEAVREQRWFEKAELLHTPGPRTGTYAYIQSALVSAWDVHLDGWFDPRLKEALHRDGYIILDYLSSGREEMSTLTMHFLRPDECVAEYRRVTRLLEKYGGFVGNVYYEDPLAFVVYGPTIPRPIVRSM